MLHAILANWTTAMLVITGTGGPFDLPAGSFRLFTDDTLAVPGLVGTYVDANLGGVSSHEDWRSTQAIAGTRTDAAIDFNSDEDWGDPAQIGISPDLEQFSAQWDGVIEVQTDGLRIATESDDSSRLWIDVNRDGVFGGEWPEFINNHWGQEQGVTRGETSDGLEPGVYPIRLQYEEKVFGNVMRLVAVPPEIVRFAYVIPSNRAAQPNAVENIQQAALLMQTWLCEQMDRAGYGPRGLRYETEADGRTPKIHVIDVAVTDETIRTYVWGETIQAALDAGLPVWSQGQIWVLFPEAHQQLPDGSIVGGTALGQGSGDGNAAGVAMLGSDLLWLDMPGALTDDRAYHGMTVPEIGPYPLVQDVSYPWFSGSTLSQLASVRVGAIMHELGHALGLAHDSRNDANFNGNLMFNGFRGIRGALLRDLYPQNDCRLAHASSLSLSVNHYLKQVDQIPPLPAHAQPPARPGSPITPGPTTDRIPPAPRCQPPQGYGVDPALELEAPDEDGPELTITTTGPLTWTNGLVRFTATTSDPSGLALALFRRNGGTLGELALNGTEAELEFRTPYLTPGESARFYVSVFDVHSNRTTSYADLTVETAAAYAPKPSFRLTPSWSDPGEDILLDATPTTDPNGNAMMFEWDLNGDGIMDTTPTSSPSLTAAFPEGTRRVGLRVTDSTGAFSVSTLIAQRAGEFYVGPCSPADVNGDGILDNGDIGAFVTLFLAGDPAADMNGDGFLDNGDIGVFVQAFLAGC